MPKKFYESKLFSEAHGPTVSGSRQVVGLGKRLEKSPVSARKFWICGITPCLFSTSRSARHTSKSRIKTRQSRALLPKLRKETHLSSLRRNIIAGHPECSKMRWIGFIQNGTTSPWGLSLTAV